MWILRFICTRVRIRTFFLDQIKLLVSTHNIIIQDRYSLTEESRYSFVKAFAELAEESYLESEH
jgi:hypothetical protein